MIHLVTGTIGGGKTTRMRELCSRLPGAGGVLSEKITESERVAGYRLIRVETGESLPLALRADIFTGEFTEACRLGPFVFSREALGAGNRWLLDACGDGGVSAVFLDEAGPLELRGEGFAPALPAVLRCGKDVYIAVRDTCLEALLFTYEIREYGLIRVDRGGI